MLKHFTLTPELLKLISGIDEFKGQWSATQFIAPDRLKSLKYVATIESIASSTRIEGAKLSDSEVEKLLKGPRIFSLRDRDEQEVIGYAEVMDTVFFSWQNILFSENYIKQLHSLLLKYSEKDERHRGEYKKIPNNIEAFDLTGKSLGVILETSSPFDTPREMYELIEWTQKGIQAKDLHPLIVIGIFVLNFLRIHPFQDGNGRLSRILTSLLLLQVGYSYISYSSLEKIIEINKENYYLTLRKAQKNPKELNVWLVFFLRCLTQQKDALIQKIESEKLLETIHPLSLQILEIIKQRGSSSIGDIVTLTKANRNTVKAHLRRLVKNASIKQIGSGKGTRYF